MLLSAMVACWGGTAPERNTTADSLQSPVATSPGVTTPTAPVQDTGTPLPASSAGSQPPAVTDTPLPSADRQMTAGEVGTAEAAVSFPVPPERDFFRLAAELIPGAGDVDRVVSYDSPTLETGHRATFNLVDLESLELYESEFELRLVTPHAYWFFEDGLQASQDDIERSAEEFEELIYPNVTAVFGTEWSPGVDGDPHLYVINARLRGAGGYYSAADEYPREVRPVSNEIEAIYVNARYLPVGSELISQVLAHELQHAVHWNADLSEETWVNEGLSELAVTFAGYPEHSILEFRRAGPTSLTQWPANNVGGADSYGAASLFMHYLAEHYSNRESLRPLLEEQADGIHGINAFLEAVGHGVTFTDVFRDWSIANLLDEDGSRFGYSDMPIKFPVYRNASIGDELQSSIPQYSNEYVRLEHSSNGARLVFEGDTTVPLLPVDVDKGCWWSNMGDVIDSTLTARLDLRQVERPLLEYSVWFSIEEDWDFAYVEVSEDNGRAWTILETPLSSTADPLNVSFGPGYTGATQGWHRESVPLDQWSGQEIMLRFQYITDAAIHDHGLCLQDIQVAGQEADSKLDAEWIPNGFVWTNNLVRQSFIVQVVYEGDEGSANRILQMELDGGNYGEITLESTPGIKRIVAVVQPLAPSTRMPANFSMRLETVD